MLALTARSAALLLPLVVSGVAAVLVLDASTGWTAAWRVVWWTSLVVACIVAGLLSLPVARRLSALGVLLGLEVEFPSPPPSRVRLAVGASTIAAARDELVRTPEETTTDELLTARMAAASMVGVFRTMEVRNEDRVRVFSTVGVALCVAVAALIVAPDRVEPPASPFGPGQQATSPVTNGTTAPSAPTSAVPTAPDGSDARESGRGTTSPPSALPTPVPEAQPVPVPEAQPVPEHGAPGGTTRGDTSNAGPVNRGAGTVAPAPVDEAAVAPPAASDGISIAALVPDGSGLPAGPQPAGILAPAARAPAPSALVPTVVTPTPVEPTESDDVAETPARGPTPDVHPASNPPPGDGHSADGPDSSPEHPSTAAPASVEHGPQAGHDPG
ncbi:MAG TPA: hypothetical protein VFW97_09810 [Acidimicrobiia bacterium]|nr:hypothetical protein [Acidimicrobiia bacterium]